MTYYVSKSGSDSNPGSIGSPWLTVDKGADTAVAGDIVRVQAGNYNETVTPAHNGSSGAGNTITFVADGTVNVTRLSFSSNSYLRFIGFNFDPSAAGGSTNGAIVTIAGTNTGIELWDCSVANSTNGSGIQVNSGATYNGSIIIGCTIHDISNDTGVKMFGNNNLVAYNDVSNIDYIGILAAGDKNRVRNNYFHALIQASSHPDFLYGSTETQGITNMLWEANLHIGTPASSDNKWFHFQNQSGTQWLNNVFRRNVTYNIGSGLYSIYGSVDAPANASIAGFRAYNNTHSFADRAHIGDSSYNNFGVVRGTLTTVYVFNDIYFQAWGSSNATQVEAWSLSVGATLTADYNLACPSTGSVTFTSQWTSQAHEVSNVDPLFVGNTSDWRLASISSGAYHAGGPVALTSGSGTGITFNVATGFGAMFTGDNSANLPQYSGALAPGDVITVGTDIVRVVSISGDAITVTPSFTWADGEPVYFGNSTTPDIGAFPYGVSPLSAATISNVSTTYTVTPTGSARGVCFYVDGIPTSYTETAPYQATIASGAVTAKAYALYAQTSPVVTASQGASSIPVRSAIYAGKTVTVTPT